MATKQTQPCIQLADLLPAMNCVDLDNRAGVVCEILFGYAEEVATWPELPSPEAETPLSYAEAGVWDGELAMANGCNMYRFAFTDEQAELAISEAGEQGGECVLYELTVTRARLQKEVFGFLNALKGRNLVVIATDKNGNKYLLGDKLSPCRKVAGDGSTTGKASTDLNQQTVKFQYYCPRYLMYAGETDSLLKPAGGGA